MSEEAQTAIRQINAIEEIENTRLSNTGFFGVWRCIAHSLIQITAQLCRLGIILRDKQPPEA